MSQHKNNNRFAIIAKQVITAGQHHVIRRTIPSNHNIIINIVSSFIIQVKKLKRKSIQKNNNQVRYFRSCVFWPAHMVHKFESIHF